ncbi:SapC family protein [Pseudocolwellia agarivorans]|uniref:SapC family protein n=1 Tax=Pseudocolwellia agarivorans TaxID=1911682 RepID=UPI0009878975|nr:SapC family protein [Pseudocolwellia agarivorans]
MNSPSIKLSNNQFVYLNKQSHGNIRFTPQINIDVLKKEQIVPLVINEFIPVATQNPIVFVKDNQTGQFRAVALYGLKSEQNLMIKNDTWQSIYLPKAVRNKYFKLIENTESAGEYLLTCRIDDPAFNQKDGEPLFEQNGKESPFLKKIQEDLLSYLHQQEITQHFFTLLLELELLTPQSLSVETPQKTYNIDGVYLIDENRLNTLADKDTIKLKQANMLPAIYAHIVSKAHILTLASRANEL